MNVFHSKHRENAPKRRDQKHIAYIALQTVYLFYTSPLKKQIFPVCYARSYGGCAFKFCTRSMSELMAVDSPGAPVEFLHETPVVKHILIADDSCQLGTSTEKFRSSSSTVFPSTDHFDVGRLILKLR